MQSHLEFADYILEEELLQEWLALKTTTIDSKLLLVISKLNPMCALHLIISMKYQCSQQCFQQLLELTAKKNRFFKIYCKTLVPYLTKQSIVNLISLTPKIYKFISTPLKKDLHLFYHIFSVQSKLAIEHFKGEITVPLALHILSIDSSLYVFRKLPLRIRNQKQVQQFITTYAPHLVFDIIPIYWDGVYQQQIEKEALLRAFQTKQATIQQLYRLSSMYQHDISFMQQAHIFLLKQSRKWLGQCKLAYSCDELIQQSIKDDFAY